MRKPAQAHIALGVDVRAGRQQGLEDALPGLEVYRIVKGCPAVLSERGRARSK